MGYYSDMQERARTREEDRLRGLIQMGFEPGVYYRLVNGQSPFRVVKINGKFADIKYVKSGMNKSVPQADIVPYYDPDPDLEQEETMTMNPPKLFSFTDADGVIHYATFLTEDSQGRAVVEVKGTGAVIPIERDKLTEVLPHTITVLTTDGKTTHFRCPEGEFEVDDLLLLRDGTVCAVTAVDTKNRSPRPTLEGWKLPARKFKFEA